MNRKISSIRWGLFLFLIFGASSLFGQNLERIGKGKAFGLSGGINANNTFYHADGVDNRRDPYNYFLSGNLNLSIYDWSVPLSFSYSNQNSTFHQPFNQYGLSPTYKWVTLHAGYRSMSFSNYTVSGHLFLGGGFDLTPSDKIKISGFYGRLQKAVEEDTTVSKNLPVYQRMGGGVKVTVGDPKNFVDLIVFKAKDDPLSLKSPPVKSDVNPEENLVLGFNFGSTLFKNLTLRGELASSAISKDTRSEKVAENNLYDKLPFAFQTRASSSYYMAYKSSMQYAFPFIGVGLAYERIDPGYRTLGAYYFNNNLESFAFTGSSVLFQKKVRANGQLGLQRNNLDRTELNTLNRISGAINVNYMISPRLVTNISYSNFQTVINFKSQFTNINNPGPYQNPDTLNYKQVAANSSMNVNYVVNQSKERRQNLSFNIAYQETADLRASVEQPTGAKFTNANFSYSLGILEHNLTVNVAANGNFSQSQAANTKIYGPTMALRKTFFEKKLSSNASFSYNNSYLNGKQGSSVTNFRLNGNYTWKEKHRFDLSITRTARNNPMSETQPRFSELVVQMGYGYNFGI